MDGDASRRRNARTFKSLTWKLDCSIRGYAAGLLFTADVYARRAIAALSIGIARSYDISCSRVERLGSTTRRAKLDFNDLKKREGKREGKTVGVEGVSLISRQLFLYRFDFIRKPRKRNAKRTARGTIEFTRDVSFAHRFILVSFFGARFFSRISSASC